MYGLIIQFGSRSASLCFNYSESIFVYFTIEKRSKQVLFKIYHGSTLYFASENEKCSINDVNPFRAVLGNARKSLKEILIIGAKTLSFIYQKTVLALQFSLDYLSISL